MAQSLTDQSETEDRYANDETEQDPTVDPVVVLQALYRSRKTILLVSTICGVLAVAIAYAIPNRYTSTVSFIPPSISSGNSMAAALAGQLSSLGGGELLGGGKTSGDLYSGILSSRSIASVLVKQFDLMKVYKVKKESQAEMSLHANTAVVLDPKSTIVTVNVTDTDPARARDLANGYMDALRQTNGRLALSQSSQKREFFGEQLAKEKDDLEDAEVDLKKNQEESGLIAPSGQTEAEIRTIAETQAQVAIRQVQLAALRQSATDQNPDVIRLRSEIGDLQGQLTRMQRGNGATSSMTIPTSKVPAIQLEYVRKQREVKYHEALFEMLSKQFEAARLDEAREAPVIQVLDAASYPDTKSGPKRLYFLLSGLLVGSLVSSVWIVSREFLSDFLSSLSTTAQ